MTRQIILGNGNMLVCLDEDARIRDFYYPYVGQENHVSSKSHRIGVWTEDKFSWVSSEEWEISMKYKEDVMTSDITAYNKNLKIRLNISETVHCDKNIFLRKVDVENIGDKRDIRVFFSQEFKISESNIGDTVYFDPITNSIINYKGRRYFLIGGEADGKPFTGYATGVSDSNNNRGTYLDAEDGVLSNNAIEHGSVDSVISFEVSPEKNKSKRINYWITVGKDHGEVSDLRESIFEEGFDNLVSETEKHWKSWLEESSIKLSPLKKEIKDLFRRSLLIVKAQTDNNGAIIASNDTDIFKFKEDTYSYMWPRDGALVARSFDKAGYSEITHQFFNFCSRVFGRAGYLLPKYRPDGSLGSSWHSWMKNGHLQLPIQEDETALVLDALWKHYKSHKCKETKKFYNLFIKHSGDFLSGFRDEATGLPKESYDLWEEKLGVHTFTCSTVYAGLEAASNFAKEFGDRRDAEKYERAAQEVKEAIIQYLYDSEEKRFIKGIYYNEKGEIVKDKTIDMSTVYGLVEFNVLPFNDKKVFSTMEKTHEKLWCAAKCGGVFRYEDDRYFRTEENKLPNPWYISTFWLAEYYIEKAKNIKDLKPAESLLEWAAERAMPSGILSEQLDPYTGESKSVSPLTWSHAGFIIACVKYLDKLKKFKK